MRTVNTCIVISIVKEESNLENEHVVEGAVENHNNYCDHCSVSSSTFYRHCLELPLTQPITLLEPVSETAIAVDERILLELDTDRGA